MDEETENKVSIVRAKAESMADSLMKQFEDQNVDPAVIGGVASLLMIQNAAKLQISINDFLELCAHMTEFYLQEYVKARSNE